MLQAKAAAGQAEGVLEVEAMLHKAGLLAPVWAKTQLQVRRGRGEWRLGECFGGTHEPRTGALHRTLLA